MVDKKYIIYLLLSGLILLTLVYSGLAYWYISVAKVKSEKQIENHALIIAYDLWSLNTSGMQAYLELAATANHYKCLEIFAGQNDSFLKISGPRLGQLDSILERMGLIDFETISAPVFYHSQEIGTLLGERYNRNIYPLFYIFLILFGLLLTLLFIFYLIFHRRLLEHQVRERTQKFHDLVSLLPEMVIETDAQGRITFANEKAQNCLGIDDVLSASYDCREFIRLENGEMTDKTVFRGSQDKELEKQEYRVRDNNGTLFPVLVRSAPIVNNDTFMGARMVIIDITERQALEAQLNRDQKMKSIGIMAGGVAHDLNNILSGIINYPELLLRQVPKNSPLLDIIVPMRDAGLRAAAVVADLLTVARGVAATRETANLNDIILDYCDSPEFEKLHSLYPAVDLKRKLEPDLHDISCSVIHVRKSLMNLVSNAFEAIKEKGHLTITTGNREVESTISTNHGIIDPGRYVTLTVADSGKGIPQTELIHIFEPFFSKKELGRSGTGLGLTVVSNTVEDHEGGITVDSTTEGSNFTLYFPILKEGVNQARYVQVEEDLSGKGQSILIVDDEFYQRDIATRLLSALGYRVASVASGETAIEYLHENTVDLVLLDMIMESGMNGFETYTKILQVSPGQKAVIISGFSENEDVKNTIKLGAGGLVNKPYTGDQLAKAVFDELNRN